MKITERVRSFFSAAVDLPEPPKPTKSQAFPSYIKTARQSSDTFLPQDDPRLASVDLETLRSTSRTSPELIRRLSKASPDLSAAVFMNSRMGVSPNYLVLARNLDGSLHPEGTQAVQELCRRFDLANTGKGFNDYPTIRAVSESLVTELFRFGGMALELILDKSRLPEGFRAVSVEGLKFKYDPTGKRRVPYQVVGGDEISLDIPTFFYRDLDRDLLDPYPQSPVQAGLQPIQGSTSFQNDMRRVARRAVHPRVRAMINDEKWRRTVPPHILHDPDLLMAYADETVDSLRDVLDGLNPEDALVGFDSVVIDYLTSGNNSLDALWETISEIQNSKMSAGIKTQPVILSHGAAAGVGLSSTQSMLAVKVYSSLQKALNELFSRALTVATRLYGIDCVVEFRYAEVDLRPSAELEAYSQMKQDRLLRQLSLGLVTDEEIALELTGSLPPQGAPKLSGTFFSAAAAPTIANPNSQTSTMNAGPIAPDTPAAPKSGRK